MSKDIKNYKIQEISKWKKTQKTQHQVKKIIFRKCEKKEKKHKKWWVGYVAKIEVRMAQKNFFFSHELAKKIYQKQKCRRNNLNFMFLQKSRKKKKKKKKPWWKLFDIIFCLDDIDKKN